MHIERGIMATQTINLEEKLSQILTDFGRPIDEAAREMIVSGLYARGHISSVQAGALLGMGRFTFIQRMKLSAVIRNPRRIALLFGGTCATALLGNIGLLANMNHGHRGSYLLLCSVVGGLIGWALAVLASPTEKEKKMFAGYAKIISGFLTAYVFVRLDPILKDFVDDPKLRTEVAVVQLGYGLAFFLIGLMWTFLVRRYSKTPSDE